MKKMIMKYFNLQEVKSLVDVKVQYIALAKKHHPDCGGDVEIMKQVNNEFDELNKNIEKYIAKKQDETQWQFDYENQVTENFVNIITDLLKYDCLTIEVLGSWIWIEWDILQNSKEYNLEIRTQLKEYNFKYAGKKKKWYLGESKSKGYGKTSMDDIRRKYDGGIVSKEGTKTTRKQIS